MSNETMTYKGSGVNYEAMDPFKRACQLAGRETIANLKNFLGFEELAGCRGESVHMVKTPFGYIATVNEGLGTKNLIADALYEIDKSISHHDSCSEDTVAMVTNDLITLGASPVVLHMHIAAGKSEWFENDKIIEKIISGWKRGCDLSGAIWGGGETPTLQGIIDDETVALSGSGWGFLKDEKNLMSQTKIQDGDAILILESSGVHANGLTLARKIAANLPNGYEEKLPNGKTYGETLLTATRIYADFIHMCQTLELELHYSVNITGHGWRKFMRAEAPWTYVIEELPTQLPIFDFIQKNGPVADTEMYGQYNMGAGFVVFLPEKEAERVIDGAEKSRLPYRVFKAGHIEAGEKQVIIKPKNLVFKGDSLQVR